MAIKVKVGDTVNTDCGKGKIVFIGTEKIVYRDEDGNEWTEDEYELSASVECEVEFEKKVEKKKK